MTRKQAIREIKKNVRAMLKNAEKLAMEKIDKLDHSGVDIAGHHIRAAGPYTVPRLFLWAFGDEIKHQYGQIWKGEHSKLKTARNYYNNF